MMLVEIPGIGVVEFPDGTDAATIKRVYDRAAGGAQPAPKGWVAEGGGATAVEEIDRIARNAPLSGVVFNNVVGDDDPDSQNLGERIGSVLHKGGESMTFGLVGDEASAAVESLAPGVNYADRRDHYRQQEEVLERDNPALAMGAEIGGGLVGAAVPVLGTLGTLGKGARLLPRIAASTAAGAGMGGTYGFMEGEGVEDRASQGRLGAGIGAIVGALAPAVGAGVQRLADRRVGNAALRGAVESAETAAQQRGASGAAYDVFDGADAQISPEGLTRLRQQLDAVLPQKGLGTLPGVANRTPGGQQILNTVGAMDDQVRAAAAAGQNPAVPLKSIEELRRFAGDVAQDVNPIGRPTADARMGNIAVDEIDSFVDGLRAADVPIGDVKTATDALKKARELWARATKTQLLENVLGAQDDYLGGAASAIRNKVGTLLRNPKTARQFSEAEKVVLRRIIGGNGLSRAIRLAGNGIGRQLQMMTGGALGGIPGAVAGALTGELSAEVANRNAIRAAEIARALVASGNAQTLPVATDQARRIVESLTRRTGAAVPQ